MNNGSSAISLEEATHEVALVSRRIALLHLAYARMLVEEFGEERGVMLIMKAIKSYGMEVGKQAREAVLEQGLALTPENFSAGSARSLPKIGMHSGREYLEVDGEHRHRTYGCVMGKLWNELGEGKLGRLYCLVDPAKYMAFNPQYILAHAQSLPDGDSCCEFCVRHTTEQEREDFFSDEADWRYMDRC